MELLAKLIMPLTVQEIFYSTNSFLGATLINNWYEQKSFKWV